MGTKSVTSWNDFFSKPGHLRRIPPVSAFPNAPLADIWTEITESAIGKSIEIPNVYIRSSDRTVVYWIGRIQLFAGYKAMIKFERFKMKPDMFVWISYCSSVPKYLGYSTQNNLLLHPMLDVANVYPNFLDKLEKSLKPYRTVSGNHGNYIRDHIKAIHQRYPLGSKIEVLDRTAIWRTRVANVTSYIGDRLHITYDFEPVLADEGYIFSAFSNSIHPIGWSKEVGHEIYMPIKPKERFPSKDFQFPSYPSNVILEVGQVFEARHPLKTYILTTAKVAQVLKHGYFMAEFTSNPAEIKKPLLYCFHVSSPYIFPTGYCRRYQLPIFVCQKVVGPEAPLHLLPKKPRHQFRKGMKFEAVDHCDPSYLGPVTVIRTSQHLLRIHYDGWSKSDKRNTAWVSADSDQIYPAGYSELVGYKLYTSPKL